ncbi:MAG: type II toxin-antitoxin system RatA family toxin [Rhodoplanes sp.]|uniref:type II toxin-antitoxin system RatA family toxin n=1 Tax=Rhodoplanes sp. TaxID=1968906 RepID=UPI0017CA231D|nr:type II toxin-antitoxin system RatA family toxin [Rhodoplanes sp.]NVO17835.1 type II toxin-antitoxin system RatA family toxin [Rhodoplanes sp.]
MPRFRARRRVRHAAGDMFDLVADMDNYPKFVPLCTDMKVRGHTSPGEGIEVAIARMTVSYKVFHEHFTTRVTMNRPELWITVDYLDGPLKVLSNRWTFKPIDANTSDVEFFIDYEFKSRILSGLMGAVFDAAFRRFASAFEARADVVYGKDQRAVAYE